MGVRMQCAHCGTENEPSNRYCSDCGQPLLVEARCRRCGVESPPASRYCTGCGAKLKKRRQAASAPPVCRRAVLSVVLALLGPLGGGLPSLLAFGLARSASRQIGASDGHLRGVGYAVAGQVLAGLGLAAVAVAVAVLAHDAMQRRLDLAQGQVYRLHEELLPDLTDPVVVVNGHWAGVVQHNGRQAVVYDGQQGRDWDEVDDLLLSPDGGRCAYAVREGGGSRVVVDGQAGPRFAAVWLGDDPFTPIDTGPAVSDAFSPDGRRLVYVASFGLDYLVVLDGRPGPVHSSMVVGPKWSGDSRHCAYAARNYLADPTRPGVGNAKLPVEVYCDERAGASYGGVLDLRYPAKGDRLAVVARMGGAEKLVEGLAELAPGQALVRACDLSHVDPPGREGGCACFVVSGGRYTVVVDGQAHNGDLQVGREGMAFSDDGGLLAYSVQDPDGRWHMLRDGHDEGAAYQALGGSGAKFSADGKHLAFVGCDAAKWSCQPGLDERDELVANYPADGWVAPSDDLPEPVPVGPPADSENVGWYGGQCVVVCDGRPGRAYEGIQAGSLRFAPRGSRWAYVARRRVTGEARPRSLVVDGAREGPAYQQTSNPQFSPDGQHLAYAARHNGRCFVVLDGRAGPAVSGPEAWIHTLSFSSDSRHLAYAAQTAKGSVQIGFDRRLGARFERILDGPVWGADGCLSCIGVRRGRTRLVRLTPLSGWRRP